MPWLVLFNCGGLYNTRIAVCLEADFQPLYQQRMATNSFKIFLAQVKSSPEQLKIRILQVVFDIIMVHEDKIFKDSGVTVSPLSVRLK